MAYNKKTITEVMKEIDERRLILPAIQRKYVWDEDQITKLMDSIVREYPFGTFLFWKVKKATINENRYPMYEFIKDYHEKDFYKNPHISLPFALTKDSENDTICAVLDGQQRLTSLYIALKGSLSLKIPKKKWDNPNAFPKKELYFNLLSKKQNEDDDIQYKFKFLTAEEAAESNDETIWYKVKDILGFPSEGKLNLFIAQNNWMTNELIVDNMSQVYYALKINDPINYFEISEESMDNVLDIFVRVNSGGTVLSKTDLLFSTIVAYWQDARDNIDDFLSHINRIGNHYEFNSDFIMRACLYMLDMSTVMKVANFKQDNINEIKTHWKDIKAAIKDTVELLDELGFSSDNIVSNNAILPIIYYRFRKGKDAFSAPEVKESIRKYFVVAQAKKVFGNHTNQTLDIFRNLMREIEVFDYDAIKDVRLADERTLACSSEDIEAWLSEFKKGPYAFLLLTLLYPDLKYSKENFEQDHMYPFAGFSYANLKKIVLKDGDRPLTTAEITDWTEKRDTLPNLQLLTSSENEKKSNMEFKKWVEAGNEDRYLPKSEDDYEFRDFANFYEARKQIVKEKLEEILLD